MKKIFKIIGLLVLLMIVVVGGLMSYVRLGLPDVGEAPEIQVEATPERIARGKYLATSVTLCVDCHSTRDFTKFAGPVIKGTEGKGGEEFNQEMGFPGRYYARNITPSGIGDWTDGEIFRAITTGVSKDGHALFPVMPYDNYSQLDQEDIYSIIAYIRTLKPIDNDIPPSTSDFPMNFIINTIPKAPNLQGIPDKEDEVKYGSYLLTAASCRHCHTPREQGEFIVARDLSGGNSFPLPNGITVYSANITPDEETGIGRWSKEYFINKFKTYADPDSHIPVGMGEFNTIMPWNEYANMTSEDLGAIYSYLRTIPPINHKVPKVPGQATAFNIKY
jgi:mono/diheme cytochrome c family protein